MAPVPGAFAVPPGALVRLAATRQRTSDLDLLHAALHSRRLVLLKALLARVGHGGLPSEAAAAFDRDWRLLARAEAPAPAAARRQLDYPAVGGWIVAALNTDGPDALATALRPLGGIAVGTALRTGARLDTVLPTADGHLTLPGIGVHATRTRHVRVRSGPRGVLLTPQGRRTRSVLLGPGGRGTGAGWTSLAVLPGSAARLDDLGTGPAPGPGTDRAAWLTRWRAAVALLEAADPWRAGEVTGLVRSVVPMTPAAEGASSGTLRAAPWAVHSALPGTARRFAEVLVHELAHSKLAVLADLLPLHDADASAVHRVAWREDLRPLGGVLQGTYAHLALADLWSRVATRPGASPDARRAARARRAEYGEQVADALPVLLNSHQLTHHGTRFTVSMKQHLHTLGQGRNTPHERSDSLSGDGDVR
ncbi:HEXXH motif-containing putative peptide modification protein [Streptomyces sp. NBC_01498]|uniref:aKG-HExxH-type peptide beta-hydroxylase n=1 Tax=Streptomyces sp. NBC_01498 TaxID=2975870 RepID=UPI002E7AD021|nr:HEXXH motif-containing putative peptide modification protein [Streptomyces sp. NBC_01498]WTL24676.1 HEXXH motif-containing putative peptide modification protein [Streptomyces sp. NBC_01498]